jgi:hypothetical protein
MTYTYDENSWSDLHKDARGHRPSGEWYEMIDTATPAEKQEVWDRLIAELEERNKIEADIEREAVLAFEQKVDALLTCGAKTRCEAIRWLVDACAGAHNEDGMVKYDPDYFCYLNDLPYGYIGKEMV